MRYQNLLQEVHFLRYYLHLTDHPLRHLLYLFRNNPDLRSRRKLIPSVHLSMHPMPLLPLHTVRPYHHFLSEHRSHRSVLRRDRLPPDRQLPCSLRFLLPLFSLKILSQRFLLCLLLLCCCFRIRRPYLLQALMW